MQRYYKRADNSHHQISKKMDIRTLNVLLKDVVSFVERVLLHEPSLYRIPGPDTEARAMLNKYLMGERPDLSAELVDPFTATTLLKYAIKNLDRPLISREFYPALKMILYFEEKLGRVPERALARVYDSFLDQDRREFFEVFAKHLLKVAGEPENNMTLINLVTVFGPTCILPYREMQLEQMRTGPAILLYIINFAAKRAGVIQSSSA